MQKPSRLISKERLEFIISKGWPSIEDLCYQCGTSYPTVLKSLKAHGLLVGRKPHNRHRLRDGSRAFKVLAYLLKNPEEPLKSVAKHFDCSIEFISQVDSMARNEGIINNDARTD